MFSRRLFLAIVLLLRISGDGARSCPAQVTAPAGGLPEPYHGVAEADQPTHVDELVAIALTNNPTIAQAARSVNALEGQYLQVGLYPNPVIGYQGEEVGDQGTAGQQGGFIRHQIVTASKLPLNRAVVSHELQQARLELAMQRLRVSTAVRGRAYETIIAASAIGVHEQIVAIGNETLSTAEELLRAQEAGQVDVLRARVEADAARLALNNARSEYESAWRRLAVVVGLPGMLPGPLSHDLEGPIPEMTWEATLSRLLLETPELARAQAKVERAQCLLARARAERVADIEWETSVRYNNSNDSTTASVGIGVPLQIFDRNQGGITKAAAELSAARREVERVELSLQDRLAAVFNRYSCARQQTRRYQSRILPDAKQALELIRQGYQQGEFAYLELLTAQRTYFQANLAYLASQRDLWLSVVEIEGILLTDGLASPGS